VHVCRRHPYFLRKPFVSLGATAHLFGFPKRVERLMRRLYSLIIPFIVSIRFRLD
jgi:hypothetical protein